MDLIKELNKDLESGFSKRDLERLIGLPENCLSNILKGNKKLSRKSEIKIEKWAVSEKPDPLNLPSSKKEGRDNQFENAARGRDKSGVNEDEIKFQKSTPKSYDGSKASTEEKEYDFIGHDFLKIEEYTEYPMKDIPKNQIQAQVYLKDKKISDDKIRLAWATYKSQKK